MMGRKEFSCPNLGNKKPYLYYLFNIYFFEKNLVKITLAEFFFKMLSFTDVHPSLYLWTHEMGVGNGILINCKRS